MKNEKDSQKQRKYFSKSYKRKALLEFSKGKRASDIIENESEDKKYASKLIHKWRRELYINRNLITLAPENIEVDYCPAEIDEIGTDNEKDDVLEWHLERIKRKKYT